MSIALQFNGYRANCSSQPAEAKKCYFPEMVRLFCFFVCQSWLLQHSICFSFLMQSQNGFSYLFVNAAVVPAFVHHWRDQEEEKNEFRASTFDATTRCNYSMESWSADLDRSRSNTSLIHLLCHCLIFTGISTHFQYVFRSQSSILFLRKFNWWHDAIMVERCVRISLCFSFENYFSINKCDYIHRWRRVDSNSTPIRELKWKQSGRSI